MNRPKRTPHELSGLIREAERLARREGLTKDEVLRAALRLYASTRRWRGLQRYGAGQARRRGMTAKSVEPAVWEFRRGLYPPLH